MRTVTIVPHETRWGQVTADGSFNGDPFALLPTLDATASVSLRAPLATGEVSTTTVIVPPVASSP